MGMKEVSIKEFGMLVKYSIENGCSIYAEGVAGIGKSTIVDALSKANNRCLIDVRASTIDVGDLILRMPNAERDAMVELVNQAFKKDDAYVLLLDEFRHAEPGIRRMFYQIILDRRIGSYALPENTCIIAISNPTEEVDTEELEAPLFDRFDFKVRINFDFDVWREWAYEHSINTDVIAFLHNFSEYMHMTTNGGGQLIPVTPRTWERVSNHMDMADYILPDTIAVPFKEFREKVQFFNDIGAYVSGEKELPDDLGMQYAFCSAVLSSITNKHDDATVKAWFVDSKVHGLREEVKAFLNYAVLSTHRNKVGKPMGAYVVGLPDKVKSSIVTGYKELAYLFDDNV